jgi:sRNA-binding regulator protein Hfq
MIEAKRNEARHEGSNVNSETPRNYANPEPLNVSHTGRSVAITMINGRTETGKLKQVGQYWLSIEMTNKHDLIINKGSIITVSIL